MGFAGPSQPPLLPSSQSPERLRFQEKEGSRPEAASPGAPENHQALWMLAIIGVFAAVIGAALLVSWLLGH